jgi:cation diffusion facilitator family transporter
MTTPSSPQLSQSERYLAIRNVTLLAIGANILVTIIQITFGIIGQSQALVADGLHTLSDLIASGMTLVAAIYSTQPPDLEHPYGHRRIETLVTIAIGGLLLLMAVGLLIDTQRRLMEPDLLLQPTAISLAVAILSIVVEEILYQYTMHVAKRIHSPMLEATAWHYRSDAISSVIVLVGVTGTLMGFLWLDAVATIGISLMIGYVGISLIWMAIKELIDTGLSKEQLLEITELVKSVSGVRGLHQLRTRKMGGNILVDIHILVAPHISISEGHQISEVVRSRLMRQQAEITDVLIHIDPENDVQKSPVINLPLRDEITARLQQHWQSLAVTGAIEKITLYYLSDRLTVDIDLPLTIVPNLDEAQRLAQRFAEQVAKEPAIDTVNIYYHSYAHKSLKILKTKELKKLSH